MSLYQLELAHKEVLKMMAFEYNDSCHSDSDSSSHSHNADIIGKTQRLFLNSTCRSSESYILENNGSIQQSCKDKISVRPKFLERCSPSMTHSCTMNSLLKNKINVDNSSTCDANSKSLHQNSAVNNLGRNIETNNHEIRTFQRKQPATVDNLKKFDETLYRRKNEPVNYISKVEHKKGLKTVPNILKKNKSSGESNKNIVSVKQLNDIVKDCSIIERPISRRKHSNKTTRGINKSIKQCKQSKTLVKSDYQLTPSQTPINDTQYNKRLMLGQFDSVICIKNGNLNEMDNFSNETEEANNNKMASFSSKCSVPSSGQSDVNPVSKCYTEPNNEERKITFSSDPFKFGLEFFSCNSFPQVDNCNGDRIRPSVTFSKNCNMEKESIKQSCIEEDAFHYIDNVFRYYESRIDNACNDYKTYNQCVKVWKNVFYQTVTEEVTFKIGQRFESLLKTGGKFKKRFRIYTLFRKCKDKGECSRIFKIMALPPERFFASSNTKWIINYFWQKCQMLTVKFLKSISHKKNCQNMTSVHYFPPFHSNKHSFGSLQGRQYKYDNQVHCQNIIFFLLKLYKISSVCHPTTNDFAQLYDILTLSDDLSSLIKSIHMLHSVILFVLPLLQYLFAHKNLMRYFYCFMQESLKFDFTLPFIEETPLYSNESLSEYTDSGLEKNVSVKMNPSDDLSDSTPFQVSDGFCVDCQKISDNDNIMAGIVKEEVDTIDGIDILSFESEKDMEEYSKIQFKLMEQNKESLKSIDLSKIATVSAIIPTKTNDITKIKGWRNKNFASKSESSSSAADGNHYFSDKLTYYNCENNIGNNKITHFRSLKDQVEDCYAKKIAEDVVLRDLEKKVSTCRDIKNSVFESRILNEFLNKHSTLNISYEVPKLSAADCFKCDKNLFDIVSSNTTPINTCDPVESNIRNFSSYKPKTKAQKRLLLEMELLQERNKSSNWKPFKVSDSSVAVKKAKKLSKCPMKLKYNFNPNHKYMWIQGRPIRILGCKADSTIKKKKFLVPNVNMDCHSDLRKPEALLSKMSSETTLNTNVNEYNKIPRGDNHNNIYSQDENDTKINISISSVHEKESPKPQYKIMPRNMDGKIELNKSNYYYNLKHQAKDSVHVMYSCHNSSEKHNYCTADRYKLGLILNIGFNRPLSNDAVHNFNALKSNESVIDECWAYVAASALQSCDRKHKKVRRVIVPVVSDKIIKTTKSILSDIGENLEELNESYDLNPFLNGIENFNIPSIKVEVVDEVKNVLNDVVDYVCRLSEFPSISYDPDAPKSHSEELYLIKKKSKDKTGTTGIERELRRLINVSIVDVTPDSNSDDLNVCKRDFCFKGCICASLNGKLTQTHCRKESCMFDCKCPDNKYNNSYEYLRYHPKERKLAKEEKSWHQTVIRKQNKVISVMVGTERVKREKKLPSRFRNNVLVGKEVFSLETRSEHREINSKYSGINSKYLDPTKSGKNTALQSIKSETETSSGNASEKKSTKIKKESEKKIKGLAKTMKIESVKRTTLSKILHFCSNFEKRSLADVLVWCVIHNIYNCNCSAWVCDLKNNTLLWRPNRVCKYLSRKSMATIEFSKFKQFLKLQVYSTEKYCCRTFGSVINYALRNKSRIFQLKRVREFEKSRLSDSNSIFKLRKKEDFVMNITLPTDDNYDTDHNAVVTEAEHILTETNSENSGSCLKPHELKHLSLSLPSFSVPCKWWVIELQPVYDFILYDAQTDPISFGMLKITSENAQWRKCVVQFPLSSKANTFGIHFGAYAVNKLQNIICFGPYRLEDNHGLMLYKNINREIKIISFVDSHGKIKGEVRGFWCYLKQRDDAYNAFCNQAKEFPLCNSKGINEKQESGLIIKIVNNQQLQDTAAKNCKLNSLTHEQTKLKPITALKIKEETCEEYAETGENYQLNYMSENNGKQNQIYSKKPTTVINPVAKEQNIYCEINEKMKNNFSPEYGLLCLTSDIGYLPVTEYTSDKLTVQDPLDADIYHTFKNLESTCTWLNRYMSRKMVFEPEDLILDWIIVKPGILKHISTFDPKILDKSFVVTKEGVSLVSQSNMGPNKILAPLTKFIPVEKPRFKGKVDSQGMYSAKPTPAKRRKLSLGLEQNLWVDAPNEKKRSRISDGHQTRGFLTVKKGVKMNNTKNNKNRLVEISPQVQTLKTGRNSTCKRKEHPVQGLLCNQVVESKQDIEQQNKRKKIYVDDYIFNLNQASEGGTEITLLPEQVTKRKKIYVDDYIFKLTQTSEAGSEVPKTPVSKTDYKLRTTTEYHKVPIESIMQKKKVSKLKNSSDGCKGFPYISKNPELSITEIPKIPATAFAQKNIKGKKNLVPKNVCSLSGMKELKSVNQIGDKALKPSIEVLPHNSSVKNDLNAYKSCNSTMESKRSASPISKKCSFAFLKKRNTAVPVIERVSNSGNHSVLKAQIKSFQAPGKLKKSRNYSLNLNSVEADSMKRECQDNPDVKLKEVREKISQYKYSLGGQYQILDIVDSPLDVLPKRVLTNKTVVALKGSERQKVVAGSLVSVESDKDDKAKMLYEKNIEAQKKAMFETKNISITEVGKNNISPTEVHILRNKLIGRKSKLSVVSPKFSSGDLFLDGKKLCSVPLVMPKTESNKFVSKSK